MCHNAAAHPNIANDDGYIDWSDEEQTRRVVAIGDESMSIPGRRSLIDMPAKVVELEQRDCFFCSPECFAAWVAAKVIEDWADEPVYVRVRPPSFPEIHAHDFEAWPAASL